MKRQASFVLIVIVAVALSACSPQGSRQPADSGTPKPSSSAPSSGVQTKSPTPTQPASTFPCSNPTPSAQAPSAAELERYRAVITSANTQPMVSTSCASINYIIAGSECCGPTDRDQALVDWGLQLNPTTANWSFDIDPATLADWRAHFYAQYIPEGALIGVDSANGRVTSVVFDGNVVSALFVANLDQMTQ